MKYLILTLIVMGQFQLNAQKYSLINGDTLQFKKQVYSSQIVAQDASGFYVYTSGEDKYIRKLGMNDAKVIFETNMSTNKDVFKVSLNHGYDVVKVDVAKNRILCFVKVDDHSDYILTLLEFDSQSGKQIREPIVFEEQSYKGYNEYTSNEKKMGKVDFKIILSPDKTKLLVVTEKFKNEKEPDVTATLYDLNGYKKIWEKQTIKIFNNSTVFTYNYLIDNDANFFYLFKYLRSKQENDISKGVGMISKNDFQNKTYAIPDKGKTIEETKLNIYQNKVLCYGKFLDGEYKSYYMNIESCGYFFITIDAASLNTETVSFDYTKDYYKGYAGTSTPLEGSKDVSVVKMNGSYYFIKEWIARQGDFYFEMNIRICKYTHMGKLEWMKDVIRDCLSPEKISGEKVRGFDFVVNDNKINLFYNEHKKNLIKFPDVNQTDESKYITLKSAKDAVLVCTTINENGVLSREIVPKEQTIFLDRSYLQNSRIENNKNLIIKNFMEKDKCSYGIFQVAP